MIIDLTHNKIVADTMTESFAKGVTERLIPLLSEKYSDTEIVGVQMYEDYIADGFCYRGKWYYPLTVVTTDGTYTEWVSWDFDKKNFDGASPYAYVGKEPLDFAITVNVPSEFEERLSGRARFCEGGLVKLRVETTAPDITLLSGKYSQTFIDEMARQLTVAVESASSVSGLSESGIEFSLVFTSGTYMEHISENVTYRRLKMTDGVGAPRDFWIKWTRLDGAVAYSVSANVGSENILFELGEDVSQKVREKEYRYLVYEGKDKYHNAMGRKNVTEWREVIKRALRRGELTKVERETELSEEALELQRRLADMLGVKAPETASEPEEIKTGIELARALEALKETASIEESSIEVTEDVTVEIPTPEETVEADAVELNEEESIPESASDDSAIDEPAPVEALDTNDEKTSEPSEVRFFDNGEESDEDEVEELDELEALYSDEEPLETHEGVVPTTDEEAAELDEITRQALEALQFAKERQKAAPADPIQFEMDDLLLLPHEEEASVDTAEQTDSEYAAEDEHGEPDDMLSDDTVSEEDINDLRALDPDEDEELADVETPVEDAVINDESLAVREDEIRREVMTEITLEQESLARRRAEEEAAKLRREQEALKLENERIIAEAKREQERLRVEYERLREQTKRADAIREAKEAVRRAEEEKLRAQIELQLRAEARERERLAEAARMAIEEQHRLEEERARAERERIEEERRREEARIRAEEKAREEAIREAEAARIRREAEVARAAAEAVMKEVGDPQYKYTSKLVTLIFRKSVDPNITKRIHEIIKATIEYYAKDKIYLKIRATIPDSQTVCLEFVQIPLEEMQLLKDIVKILGNSGIGIVKARID